MPKHAEALLLYERSLAIVEEKIGPDHVSTRVTVHNLAGLHIAMGEHAKALPLYVCLLPIKAAELEAL